MLVLQRPFNSLTREYEMFVKSEISSFGVELYYIAITVPKSMTTDYGTVSNYMRQYYGMNAEDLNGSTTYVDSNGTFHALIACTKPQSDEEGWDENPETVVWLGREF